jgi:CubicO group peptidase (beta-lactamase class C family)
MNTTLRYGTPEEAGMDPKRIEHIKDLARGWVEQGITPSLVVLAARRGVIVLHEAYGVMGPEPDAGTLQRDSIFPLASISKIITATAAMCLVEDGLLGLNRPVQWYLPEFVGEGKDAVMVHHLLTHTSGLALAKVLATAEAQLGRVLHWPPDDQWVLTNAEFVRASLVTPLTYATGTEMRYSTVNYELLGEIIRRLAHEPFPSFCERRILAPLGMQDTLWYPDSQHRQRLVRMAPRSFLSFIDRADVRAFVEASAALISSAMDMAVLGQMLLNGGRYGQAHILGRPAVEAMTRNQIPGIPGTAHGLPIREASWGLGPNVCGDKHCVGAAGWLRSSRMFGHDGWNGVELWVDPGFDLMTVYLSVASERGIPPGIQVRESFRWPLMQRRDLFLDALLGSIID